MTVLSLPLQVAADGGMLTVPADSPQAIAQSTALLLDTRPGERRAIRAYGSPDPRFSGLDVAAAQAAVATWEPRADPLQVTVVDDHADGTRWQYVTALPASEQAL